MAIENSTVAHRRDVSELPPPVGAKSPQEFGVDPTQRGFNDDFRAATTRPDTARVADLTIHNPDVARVSDQNRPNADALNPTPGIRFENRGSSTKFANDTQEAFRESFGRLNPETQKKLEGLHVITTDHTKKAIPGMPDVPGVTPDLEERKKVGNIMALTEPAMKAQKANVKDVMNHEIFHPIDNATGASRDPELRKAIDLGISRLSPLERKHIAAHNKDERDQRYAEFSGDVMALEVGSKQKDLAYLRDLKDPYGKFKEAREIMRKRYLKPEE